MTETIITPTHQPNTETEAAVGAGVALAEPHKLDEGGRFFFAAVGQGTVIDLEAERDKHRDAPPRKTGRYAVHDAESFVAYVDKHSQGPDVTEVWADITSRQVVAVIDAHPRAGSGWPGWGEHRVVLRLQETPSWQTWIKHNGTQFSQVMFAEFIEANRINVVDPDAATLTEISRTFKATKTLLFDESHHLSTGQVQLHYHEEIEAKGGRRGEVEIPEAFALSLAPFEGSGQYAVAARLRFDISHGSLILKYVLDRPEEFLREAFEDVVAEIKEGVNAPLFHGVSP